jgi:hypothetical protein
MSLQAIAAADLAVTLEGDGQSVTLTNPSGTSAVLQGISNDISLLIDTETGVPVSGRNANVSLRIASVRGAGLDLPQGIEDGAMSPWLVAYTTTTGESITTKVMATNPDRAMGIVTCRLELVA